MKELIEKLRSDGEDCECEAHSSNECCCDAVWGSDYTRVAADAIERLENEALAADIRMDNDKLEIAGLTREQVGLALDAARLEWAMNNMCQHNYTLFGMHVMNVGGTGDIHDCRSFIDSMKGGVE